MKRIKRYFTLLRIFLRGGYSRAEYLKKKKYFGRIGNHCYFQIYNFGTEPHLLSFGNNVHIASGVRFISHDITSFVFNYMDDKDYPVRRGYITIGNNVFIGAYSIILYDVKIGNNVIIGAGSVITKDIPDGVVAAGVPCKVIGDFMEYKNKICL